ncbi:egf-like repeat and discoidin i-like domain-containing protein 3 [Limosa lapponica baueri]|uniref:Egf-like repeat and discoidin i-like domain-containing protein 3 n=1 Tax=Limosa lapponica baueri TaxID=1758121 RepID=A0A2I0TPA1_LIMLA|nr:egf-like repeat and discoidin i-like domain-containing protein 3 [Limosa lapponica baueri]
MGNKQEELEAIVQQESYDVVTITETWWDNLHDWSAAMDGYKLFRRDRPPNQDVEIDEIFYKQLGEVSRSLALVLVRDFNLPDNSWAHNTAEREQSRRFLQCVRDNFLTQLGPEEIAEPLSTIFKKLWQSGKVPRDWKRGKVMSNFKKGKNEDPGNYRPVSLTSVPGKIMEQILLEDMSKQMVDREAVQKGQGRKEGGGVALYIKKWLECEELSLKNSHEQVESLWVRIRDRGNKGNLVVGVYYRPPDQGEPIDEAFLLQLQKASRSQSLVLLGDFSHPDICWKSSTASCIQSRRFLECIGDKFLSQAIDSPTRGDAILDLMATKVSELINDIQIGGSLGCSDHALVESGVLRDMGQAKSKVGTLNFRKANFQLFKALVNGTPWDTAFRDKGAEQSWQIFKDAFHRA